MSWGRGWSAVRVLLLGAAGACGSVALRHLCLSRDVEEVVAADVRITPLQRLIRRLATEKVRPLKLDVRDKNALIKAMEEADVVADATTYVHNLLVMKAALEAGKSLTDLGGMFYITREQLELDGAFREAGLTAITGCGLAPGIAEVLAVKGAEHVDRIRAIRIRYGEVDFTPALYKRSFRALLDGLTMRPVIYRRGEFVELPPFSGKEFFDFPEPIGTRLCIYAVYPGIMTLPRNVGKDVELVEAKFGFSDTERLEAVVSTLRTLGLLDEEPLKVDGVEVRPREVLLACAPPPEPGVEDAVSLIVLVEGLRDGEEVLVRYTLTQAFHRTWGVSALSYLTGVSLSIATQMLGEGRVAGPGVMSLEGAVEADTFIRALRAEGVRISEEVVVRREL